MVADWLDYVGHSIWLVRESGSRPDWL